MIFDAFTLLIREKNVANYALLQCKFFSLKIWLCKIFDKFHVWSKTVQSIQNDPMWSRIVMWICGPGISEMYFFRFHCKRKKVPLVRPPARISSPSSPPFHSFPPSLPSPTSPSNYFFFLFKFQDQVPISQTFLEKFFLFFRLPP